MGSVRKVSRRRQNIWAVILGGESHGSAGKKRENFLEKDGKFMGGGRVESWFV